MSEKTARININDENHYAGKLPPILRHKNDELLKGAFKESFLLLVYPAAEDVVDFPNAVNYRNIWRD